MAAFVLTDASVTINSVDLSDHVKSVTFPYSADAQEYTAMGDTTHVFLGGLKSWNMDIEFNQDFAANEVDVTLFSIVGTAVTIIIVPTSGSVSATNPSFTGTGLIQSYTPVAGSVGDVATASLHVEPGGALTRATS